MRKQAEVGIPAGKWRDWAVYLTPLVLGLSELQLKERPESLRACGNHNWEPVPGTGKEAMSAGLVLRLLGEGILKGTHDKAWMCSKIVSQIEKPFIKGHHV